MSVPCRKNAGKMSRDGNGRYRVEISDSCGTWSGTGRNTKLSQGNNTRGAGGPNALLTSPPERKRYRVDPNPHAALSGLICRTSLDSARLLRNRSLLLCGTQTSPFTCARDADRAKQVRGPSRTAWQYSSAALAGQERRKKNFSAVGFPTKQAATRSSSFAVASPMQLSAAP